jgi:hypothetical protein
MNTSQPLLSLLKPLLALINQLLLHSLPRILPRIQTLMLLLRHLYPREAQLAQAQLAIPPRCFVHLLKHSSAGTTAIHTHARTHTHTQYIHTYIHTFIHRYVDTLIHIKCFCNLSPSPFFLTLPPISGRVGGLGGGWCVCVCVCVCVFVCVFCVCVCVMQVCNRDAEERGRSAKIRALRHDASCAW